MNELLKLIYFVLICALLLLGYIIYLKGFNGDNPTNNYGTCGTVSLPTKSSNFSDGSLELGKTIFKNNCAQCHAKNMISDLTGPPLKNSINRWNSDTIKFGKYLNNSDKYLEEFNDKRMLEMRRNYKFTANSHQYEFTEEDINSILFYIEGVIAFD